MAALETQRRRRQGGIGAKTAALMRMLRGIVEAVSKTSPSGSSRCCATWPPPSAS